MTQAPLSPGLSTCRSLWRVALVTLLGIFSAMTMALAADPAGFDTAFATFQRASAGDESAVDGAAAQFAALSAAAPTDPVLLAYAGAAGSLRARSTLLPWKKMS